MGFIGVGFYRVMDYFDSLGKKRKENIEKLQKQKEEEELRLLKDPETNREENLKYNLNPKNYNITERLYIEDIKKRKDKKAVLDKIYTPSFQPQIYTERNRDRDRENLYNNINHSRNVGIFKKKRNYTEENIIEDDYYEEKKNNYNIEKDERNEEEEREEELDIFKNVKKNNKEGRNKLNKLKKEIKRNKTEEVDSSSDEEVDNKDTLENKNIIIELKLRNMLFNKKKNVSKRNNSVEKRKNAGFNLE